MIRLRVHVLALAVATAAVPSGARAQDDDGGRADYDRACARCHADPAELADVISSDPDEARAELDDLLSRHHPPADDVRGRIVDYLVDLARR
jgi:cytochrome c553